MSLVDCGFLKGIYAAPGAVLHCPKTMQRLVEERGVNLFVLRTGFDPASHDTSIKEAMHILRGLDVEVWFLVGAWWGIGVDPGDLAMRSQCPWQGYGTQWAHESRWRMHTPDGNFDDVVAEALAGFASEYAPDGFCLTHARFRHPADIPGLFETGGDLEGHDLACAFEAVNARLKTLDPISLKTVASGCALAAFLDRLAGGTVFRQWFSMRSEKVQASCERFRKAVRSTRSGRPLFGVNAFGPMGDGLCGQEYTTLHETCDFVQPLLGYMRWHVMHTVGSWARFFCEHVWGLNENEAVEISVGLFDLEGIPFPDTLDAYSEKGEGDSGLIMSVVERQLAMCRAATSRYFPVFPVLRGSDWPMGVVDEISALVERDGFSGVIYQGVDTLVEDCGEEWK